MKREIKRAVKTYRWRNFPLDLSNDFQPPSKPSDNQHQSDSKGRQGETEKSQVKSGRTQSRTQKCQDCACS